MEEMPVGHNFNAKRGRSQRQHYSCDVALTNHAHYDCILIRRLMRLLAMQDELKFMEFLRRK